jgi:RNA polymerase sigma-70 factor
MADTGSPQPMRAIQNLGAEAASKGRRSEQQVIYEFLAGRVHAAWPCVHVELAPFVTHVATLLDRSLPMGEALKQLSIEDLFLAYACSVEDAFALATLTREFEAELSAIGAKFRIPSSDLDDIRQTLWNTLFLRTGDSPAVILKYGGKGQLRHWFRVLATRAVLNELRRAKSSDKLKFAVDLDFDQAATEADPELANIRHHYKHNFRVAFTKAVSKLEAHERNILRCHYIQSMSTDQIARAFGVHKATAARHVVKARERLLELTRAGLKSQLGADSRELESVLRLFDGEASLSLSRLLK